MQPLYQGKIDNFCAAYAVLNGLKLIRNISTLQARVILNEMFYYEAQNLDEWLKIIHHETDYQRLVERMLHKWAATYSYKTFCPFNPQEFAIKNSNKKNSAFNAKGNGTLSDSKSDSQINSNSNPDADFYPEVDKDIMWDTLKQYTQEKESTVVLRFCRFIPNQVGPLVDHWTTLSKVTETELHFFDCSMETTGWYVIPREKVYVAPFGKLPPQSIGLLQGMTLSLDKEEFAIIPPENIHVLKVVKSAFGF